MLKLNIEDVHGFLDELLALYQFQIRLNPTEKLLLKLQAHHWLPLYYKQVELTYEMAMAINCKMPLELTTEQKTLFMNILSEREVYVYSKAQQGYIYVRLYIAPYMIKNIEADDMQSFLWNPPKDWLERYWALSPDLPWYHADIQFFVKIRQYAFNIKLVVENVADSLWYLVRKRVQYDSSALIYIIYWYGSRTDLYTLAAAELANLATFYELMRPLEHLTDSLPRCIPLPIVLPELTDELYGVTNPLVVPKWLNYSGATRRAAKHLTVIYVALDLSNEAKLVFGDKLELYCIYKNIFYDYTSIANDIIVQNRLKLRGVPYEIVLNELQDFLEKATHKAYYATEAELRHYAINGSYLPEPSSRAWYLKRALWRYDSTALSIPKGVTEITAYNTRQYLPIFSEFVNNYHLQAPDSGNMPDGAWYETGPGFNPEAATEEIRNNRRRPWFTLADGINSYLASIISGKTCIWPKVDWTVSSIKNYITMSYLTFTTVVLLIIISYKKWKTKAKVNMLGFTFMGVSFTLISLLILQVKLYSIQEKNLSTSYTGLFYQNTNTITIEIVITLLALIILWANKDFCILKEKHRLPSYEHQLLLLWVILGLITMINANDLLTLYFGLECQAIASYVLTGLRTKNSFATEASLKYLLISGFGTAILLLGIGLCYGSQNTTNLWELANNLQLVTNSQADSTLIYSYEEQSMVWLSFFFIIIGFLLKIGIAPYHVWLPDVYEGASSFIVSFFAVIPKLVLITILAQMFLSIQTLPENILTDSKIKWLLVIFAFLSIFIGSLGAYLQVDIKRFLAYSSIAHVGYMLLTVCISKIPFALLMYILHYIIATTLIFIFINNTREARNDFRILKKMHHISLLNKTNPTATMLLVLILFSIAGIPPLWGFFPKIAIIYATIISGDLFFTIWLFIGTCLSIFIYIKLIKILLTKQSPHHWAIQKRIPKSAALVLSFGSISILNYIFVPDGVVRAIIKYIKESM